MLFNPPLAAFDPMYLVTALVLLLMASLLVAVHEYGHYLFARLFKMEVEEFAIGFGPKPWVYRRKNGTMYTFRPIPLGGFVRIKGMAPEEDGSEIGIEGGFFSKSPFARFMTLLAGPLFSVVAGIVILAAVYMTVGANQIAVEEVVAGSPAQKAGLQPGDRLLRINGASVLDAGDLVKVVSDKIGEPVNLTYARKTQTHTIQIVPEASDTPELIYGPDGLPTGEKKVQGRVGVKMKPAKVPLAPGQATLTALKMPLVAVQRLLSLIPKPAELKEQVGGPVRIASVTNQVVRHGVPQVIELAALLSISIGIFNLFPIYPLDGGQMLVSVVEMFRRGRRLSFELQNRIAGLGFVMVLTLVAFVFYADIQRMVTSKARVEKALKIIDEHEKSTTQQKEQ